MAIEIERKFLVDLNGIDLSTYNSVEIEQGYFYPCIDPAIRIRIQGCYGWLCVKGLNKGITRAEYEYQVALSDAVEMMKMCGDSRVRKTRYFVDDWKPDMWEVDVFHDRHEGLVMAEIELQSEEQKFQNPIWITEEVSSDNSYYNIELAHK